MPKSFFVIGVGSLVILLTFQGCSSNTQAKDQLEDTYSANASSGDSAGPMRNVGAKPNGGGPFKVFKVYSDSSAPNDHFTPSGWMGDYGDLSVDEKSTEAPHAGSTSIKIVYTGKAAQGARWVGLYWQNPPNNWGTRPGGYDLSGAKKLTFWARGEKGGERIEEFRIGGVSGEYPDSDVAGIGPVVLTAEWKQYVIDLEGKDLSCISGGFAWSTNLDVAPGGCTFYLDDISYE